MPRPPDQFSPDDDGLLSYSVGRSKTYVGAGVGDPVSVGEGMLYDGRVGGQEELDATLLDAQELIQVEGGQAVCVVLLQVARFRALCFYLITSQLSAQVVSQLCAQVVSQLSAWLSAQVSQLSAQVSLPASSAQVSLPAQCPGESPAQCPGSLPAQCPGESPSSVPRWVSQLSAQVVPSSVPSSVPSESPSSVPRWVSQLSAQVSLLALCPGSLPALCPGGFPALCPARIKATVMFGFNSSVMDDTAVSTTWASSNLTPEGPQNLTFDLRQRPASSLQVEVRSTT
ncbi:putative centlein-like [Homarus americanus]|uniref:Putative centlein-like n=1 Tax=Homarus americanus TaxID=6706 RepID=A0A8J5N452_HOMAM|nr:putative centlein-like [Homarus americanus]